MKKLILAALLALSGAVQADNTGTDVGTTQPHPQDNGQMMQNKEEMMRHMQSMSPEQRAQMMEKAREYMQSMTPEQREKMQSMMQGKKGRAQ